MAEDASIIVVAISITEAMRRGNGNFTAQNSKKFFVQKQKSDFDRGLLPEESQPILSLSCYNPKSKADFDMGFPVLHVVIIVEILNATSNLDVITSLSEEATLIFLLAEAVDFFSKS